MTETYRVAVTVFCLAQGIDERDAGHAAEYAIRKTLGGGEQFEPTPFALDPVISHPGTPQERAWPPVEVHDVLEVGMAAGNGALWIRPTSALYHAPDEPRS